MTCEETTHFVSSFFFFFCVCKPCNYRTRTKRSAIKKQTKGEHIVEFEFVEELFPSITIYNSCPTFELILQIP